MATALGLLTRRAVLLEGPAATGKSALIDYLGHLFGGQAPLRVINTDSTTVQVRFSHTDSHLLQFVVLLLYFGFKCGCCCRCYCGHVACPDVLFSITWFLCCTAQDYVGSYLPQTGGGGGSGLPSFKVWHPATPPVWRGMCLLVVSELA
jgi:hypothetical protein